MKVIEMLEFKIMLFLVSVAECKLSKENSNLGRILKISNCNASLFSSFDFEINHNKILIINILCNNIGS